MLIRIKSFPKASDFTEDYTTIRKITRRLAQEKVLLFLNSRMLIDLSSGTTKDVFFIEYYPEDFDSLREFVDIGELEYVASYYTNTGISDKIKELLKEVEKEY